MPSGLMAERAELADDLSPAEALDTREAYGLLREAIRELPERCREAFVLHRFEGLRHRDIAKRLGISQSTVEKHIAAALVHLRHELQDLF
ncbi:MAG: sigma-70 family RNA polymerase sigma factor [Opitutales bacterium]